MSDERTITVAERSEGACASGPAGTPVSLPVVELLTGRGFVTGKSGSGKSILEGTPVYTERGRKPIEAVEEDDRVLSLNPHTYEQEFRTVQATIHHRSDDLLKLTLEDGTELVGTEDHSFLTVEGMEIVPIRGEDVSEGTWLPLSRRLPEPETRSRIDLAPYASDANNVVVDEQEIRSGRRTDDRYLDLGFDLGKVVGLYLAEGSMDGSGTIQIANLDEGVQEFLDEQGFNVYERTCNVGFQPFSAFLREEFGTGSDGKRVAGWVHDTPSAFRAGLLSGYVDGDGTVTENSVTAISKSPALLDGIAELCRQFGVSTTVRDKFTVYDGERRRYRRLRVDAFTLERFADVVQLSVAAKADSLDRVCDALEAGERYNARDMIPSFGPVLNLAARERGWTERDSEMRVAGASVHNLTRQQKAGRRTFNRILSELDVEGRAKQFGQSDIQWQRVVEVERLDEERSVYDLDVAGNDNFVADGVFVHNSNSASVIAENLLDEGFGLLIVDIDGEYYGLKEEYEILHAGADEECDIQVTPGHAEKLATLALEQNVPIILDVSSFLDESEARALLTAVAKQLFVKAKKLKQPFLLLVEEIHEYIPENGSIDECGRMLIKIGKRGRKHGLGITGISQRPADVKKDFITQCDWLVWHRLTWNNDTTVVRRVLDGEYADAVEDLDDGEGFLVTDWFESVRRVQFHRKRTFDAGATPGLEEVDRPELKSVSDDLVSELESISEARREHDDEIARLKEDLDRKNSRIAELERELQDARDLSRMADQFVSALVDEVEGAAPGQTAVERMRSRRAFRETGDPRDAGIRMSEDESDPVTAGASDDEVAAALDGDVASDPEGAEVSADGVGADTAGDDGEDDPDLGTDPLAFSGADVSGTNQGSDDAVAAAVKAIDPSPDTEQSVGRSDRETPSVSEVRRIVRFLDEISRRMLAYYYHEGPATPLDAHFVAGGDGDRTDAYAHNHELRTEGLIEHVGRGRYDTRLDDRIADATDDQLDADELSVFVEGIASMLSLPSDEPNPDSESV